MRRRVVLVLTLAAAACGGASGDDGDGGTGGPDAVEVPAELSCTPRSGTRLRRLLRNHDDGTSVDVGVYDTVTASECTFTTATDGSEVCVPSTGVIDALPRWLDPTCSGEMVGETFGEVVIGDAIVRLTFDDGDVCTNEPTFFAASGEITPDAGITTGYTRTGDVCAEVGYVLASYARLTGPAELATVTASFVGGRLQVTQLDGADGSRFCDGFAPLRDTGDDGRACELTVTTDDTIRCVPQGSFASSLYTDATCTDDVEVVLPSSCGGASGIARSFEGYGSCLRTTIREIGAAAPPTLHEQGFETCDLYAGGTPHLIGATLAPDLFPGLTRANKPIGGRLLRGDLAGGGLRIFRSQLRDADLDTPCSFVAVPDDDPENNAPTLRCLPEASTAREDTVAQVELGYSDAACTIPFTLASVDAACATNVPRYARQDTRVFRVGSLNAAPFYLLGDGCVADTTRVRYDLAEELPPTMFVSGVVQPE